MISKVSVLHCSYNAEVYIRATLQSLLAQTYTNIEILILDNNSKDTTVEIIKSYKDTRIRLYLSEKNLGPY